MAIPQPAGTPVEETIIAAVQWLRITVEAVGALVIAAGIGAAALTFARHLVRRNVGRACGSELQGSRRVLAHYLAVALEFQLAADVLSTAVAPSWNQIGKLVAIAAIRTALNYFLSRETEEQLPAA